jgi:chromosome segregation ATPase
LIKVMVDLVLDEAANDVNQHEAAALVATGATVATVETMTAAMPAATAAPTAAPTTTLDDELRSEHADVSSDMSSEPSSDRTDLSDVSTDSDDDDERRPMALNAEGHIQRLRAAVRTAREEADGLRDEVAVLQHVAAEQRAELRDLEDIHQYILDENREAYDERNEALEELEKARAELVGHEIFTEIVFADLSLLL